MKTEGLTLEEARVALAKQCEVETEGGELRWRWALGEVIQYKTPEMKGWDDGFGPERTDTTYRIIKPEPKELSFDEALARHRIRILPPKSVGFEILLIREAGNFWSLFQLAEIDLAERRGWAIVEDEEGTTPELKSITLTELKGCSVVEVEEGV